MSQELIIGIIAAVGVVTAAGLGAPRILRDARWGIQRDLEIWKALPVESTAREGLLKKIDREVKSLDIHDQKRRYPLGIGLSLSFLLMGVAGSWFVIVQGGWWWLGSPVAFLFVIFGLAGLGTYSQKTLRDEKGNTIKN